MLKKSLITIFILGFISPFVVIVILYRFAMSTNLPGRKGGPQDAFRHTYSTALTARYISPYAVRLVTFICERDPNSIFDQMDIHNNKVGTMIGLGEGDLYETVMQKIKSGKINATQEDTITWLPPEKWDYSGF